MYSASTQQHTPTHTWKMHFSRLNMFLNTGKETEVMIYATTATVHDLWGNYPTVKCYTKTGGRFL